MLFGRWAVLGKGTSGPAGPHAVFFFFNFNKKIPDIPTANSAPTATTANSQQRTALGTSRHHAHSQLSTQTMGHGSWVMGFYGLLGDP